MVEKSMPTVGTNQASRSLHGAFEYIQEKSITGASKFKDEIEKIVDHLPANPERFPPDKFKKGNSGNYRAFNKFSYRISYQIKKDKIVILRVRHEKREPLEY